MHLSSFFPCVRHLPCLSLSFSIPPFLSFPLISSLSLCLLTHQRNLCYLLVTFIWSPRVLDLSLGFLSFSTLFPLSPSRRLRPFSYYRLPTARSLEQSGTSYSGFQTRRQGGSHPLSSSSSRVLLFLRSPPVLLVSPPGPPYQGVA